MKSAPGISNRYGQVDVLFLDTEHTYVRTIAEWLAWRPYLSKQAILCLDDLYRPGVERAWNEIVGERKMRLDYLHLGADPNEGGGFGVIWGVK